MMKKEDSLGKHFVEVAKKPFQRSSSVLEENSAKLVESRNTIDGTSIFHHCSRRGVGVHWCVVLLLCENIGAFVSVET